MMGRDFLYQGSLINELDEFSAGATCVIYDPVPFFSKRLNQELY
jgi:hypothetical protein